MAKTTKKTKPTLHCQHCGKRRAMGQFLAINTNQTSDTESNTYRFKLKKFLEVIHSPAMIRFPQYYAGVCAVCYKTTFYGAKNRGTTMDVIPT